MRRNYISPEFAYQRVFGTLNMVEQSTFFGSKMLEIDDSIDIKREDIVYYQQATGEQLNLQAETSLPQKIFSSVEVKRIYHTIKLDDAQNETQKNSTAKWNITIDLRNILIEQVFALMKKYRTFEGVETDMTLARNVDQSLRDYISKNVLGRYQFNRIELYLLSIPLTNQNELKWTNTYDSTIENPANLFTKFETITDPNGIDIQVIFNQPQSASSFNFRYYYNLYYTKL